MKYKPAELDTGLFDGTGATGTNLSKGTIQIKFFHYTRCTTSNRVMSLWGPSPRHCFQATQILSKKCRNRGETLATLCPI